MYVPYLQTRMTNPVIAVRTAGAQISVMKEVRSVISQIDPSLPLMDISSQLEMVEQRFLQERVFALAYSLFGGLALLVAAIGLFGLMSYSVSRRTGEIGIRMALGAQRADVLRHVLGESLILVAIGVAIGVGVALWAGRLIATLLYGLAPTDVATMIAAVAVMVVVSAVAGYLPARRASRVDPMIALRYD
jgi:ABC-type antimicrobial peptide transport system permease subunit